mmetsp:Transcript_44030/g.141187  ORF Transcript_44030/g.141187 Transcript_44030/m.141187 type:complete len:287 (+) Transcript_44030:455-1315(+)
MVGVVHRCNHGLAARGDHASQASLALPQQPPPRVADRGDGALAQGDVADDLGDDEVHPLGQAHCSGFTLDYLDGACQPSLFHGESGPGSRVCRPLNGVDALRPCSGGDDGQQCEGPGANVRDDSGTRGPLSKGPADRDSVLRGPFLVVAHRRVVLEARAVERLAGPRLHRREPSKPCLGRDSRLRSGGRRQLRGHAGHASSPCNDSEGRLASSRAQHQPCGRGVSGQATGASAHPNSSSGSNRSGRSSHSDRRPVPQPPRPRRHARGASSPAESSHWGRERSATGL